MALRTAKPERRTGKRRVRRWALSALVVLVVAWFVACFVVVQHPTVNKLTQADAVLVLGSADQGRIDEAKSILNQHLATQLVVSDPAPDDPRVKRLCAEPIPGVTITCFQPEPSTTRGEAEEIRRLADAHHWSKLIVVTSAYHVSRARLIVSRCFPGRVEMASSAGTYSLGTWAYQYVYQTAGYVKAFAHPSC